MASMVRSRPVCALCARSRAPTLASRPAPARRYQSTATPTASNDASTSSSAPSLSSPSNSSSSAAPPSSPAASASSSSAPSSTVRIVSSILLSRPPRRQSPLTSFEREYYRYARRIQRAIGAEFNPEWYFRKGSQGEQAYKDMVAAAEQGKEVEEPKTSEQDTAQDGDLHSLERKQDRTLYFLAKKNRNDHAWQFPQGGVEGKESLVQAALRELREEFGEQLDVWQTGKVPAASHTYKLPKPTNDGRTETTVFFMPARIMRGTAAPNKEEGLVDYAWCTREEVQEKVHPEYYSALQDVLSH